MTDRPAPGPSPSLHPWLALTALAALGLALAACTTETSDYCDEATPCATGFRCNLGRLTCVPVPRSESARDAAGGSERRDGGASALAGDASVDGRSDAAVVAPPDRDGDGDPDLTDCAPDNATIAHGKAETCNKGVDDNCDGLADGAGSVGCVVYYADRDGDGFGAVGESQCLCAPKAPYLVTNERDCSDADAEIKPGARERCNGKDDDCDKLTDEADGPLPPIECKMFYPDADADGFGAAAGGKCLCAGNAAVPATNREDCYDGNVNAKPGQTAFFERDRGDGSYDYDCDGLGTPSVNASTNASCEWVNQSDNPDAEVWACIARFQYLPAAAWVGSVPACGAEGVFSRGCVDDGSMGMLGTYCHLGRTARVQGCR